MPPQTGLYGRAPGIATSRISDEAIKKWREGHGVPTYDTRQEAIQYAAMNEALRFMDPTTRGQYMRQMARDNPALFGGYAAANVPTPPGGAAAQQYNEQMLAQERLNQAIKALSPGAIERELGRGKPKTQAQRLKEQYITSEAQAPLGFLSDYLRTAQQAYGTGVQRQTRAQRSFAEKRLAELTQQSQEKPQYGAMAQLGQALVSPAMGRAPSSGGLGTERATTGIPGERRGGAARNPWLT